MDSRESYRVGYLGSSTLNQMATGLGVLQKPLRELYIPHRKPGNPTSLPERYLIVSPDGLIMSYYLQDHAPPVEEFYPISNILLWDAVRFVAVRGTEKKDKKQVKCAFEPLDNDHSRVKDNLFSTVEKKYHYVHEQNHPPMFTCVIRRKAGVKSLEAHMFICINEEEAVGIVHALNQVHGSYSSNQSQETGVFGYQPFGKGSVRAPSGSPLVRIASQKSPSSVTAVERRYTHQQTHNTVITQSPIQHTSGGQNYNSYRSNTSSSSGGSTDRRLGSHSRIFNLSQEDLVSPHFSIHPGSEERFDEIEDDDGYQYLPHITHSLERRRNNRDFESDLIGVNDLDRDFNSRPDHPNSNTRSLENGAKSKYTARDTRQIPGSVSNSGYSENKPFSYALGQAKSSPKKLNNPREDISPSSPSFNARMGQGYSLLSGPNEHPRRHASDSHAVSNSSPRQQRRDVTSSVSDNQLTQDTNRQIFRELLHYQKNQQQHQQQQQQSQIQQGNDGLYDRSGHRPPHLRPPKSPGYLDKPPGVSRNNQDDSPEDNTAVPTNIMSDPFPPRDRMNSSDAVKTKPVARVPPHMVTGVRVLPLNPSGPRRNNTSDYDPTSPPKGDRPKSGMFLQSPTSPELREHKAFGQSPRRAQSQYDIANELESKSSSLKNKQQQKESNWQLGPNGKNSSRESSLKSRSQKEIENNMDDKLGEKLLLSKKKDAEIASVMQNLRLDYKDTPTLTPGAPGGMNFEKSLGYFP